MRRIERTQLDRLRSAALEFLDHHLALARLDHHAVAASGRGPPSWRGRMPKGRHARRAGRAQSKLGRESAWVVPLSVEVANQARIIVQHLGIPPSIPRPCAKNFCGGMEFAILNCITVE